jgi:hypothetical protein
MDNSIKDARELLQSNNDWWDELTETDKSLVLRSEDQYNKGNFVSHDELMQRFEQWKRLN